MYQDRLQRYQYLHQCCVVRSATGVATQTGKDDGQVVERIVLEGPDRFAEQAGANDQDEVGHYDEENRKCCAVPGGQYYFVFRTR